MIDTLLRAADPAAHLTPDPDSPTAQALLEQILLTPAPTHRRPRTVPHRVRQLLRLPARHQPTVQTEDLLDAQPQRRVEHMLLQPAPVRRHRRPLLWLSATVIAAGLTAGGLVIADKIGSTSEQATVRPDLPTTTQLSLPFALNKSAGVQITQVTVTGVESQTVQLANASYRLQLLLTSPVGGMQPAELGDQAIDIDGIPAYYLQTPDTQSPTNPVGPNFGNAQQWPDVVRELTWQYNTGSWARLQTQGAPMSKTDLLGVATAMNFHHTTSIRSVFSLTHPPRGTRLVDLNATYHQLGEQPPFDVASTSWSTEATYLVIGGDVRTATGIDIRLSSSPPPTDVQDGSAVTLEGHTGHWNASRRQLSLTLDHAYLTISDSATIRGSGPPALTYQQAATIAATITVTPQLLDRAAWFDAARRLPTG